MKTLTMFTVNSDGNLEMSLGINEAYLEGINALSQKIVVYLLNSGGSNAYNLDIGSGIRNLIGSVTSGDTLKTLLINEINNIKALIIKEQASSSSTIPLSNSEILVDLTVLDIEVDALTNEYRVYLQVKTADNTTYALNGENGIVI